MLMSNVNNLRTGKVVTINLVNQEPLKEILLASQMKFILPKNDKTNLLLTLKTMTTY